MARPGNTSGNFFANLFASLFGGRDGENEKKRKLKAIAKRLSKTHYRFYKAGSAEVLPAFAKLFYEIYKVIAPAQRAFHTVRNEKAVKRSFVDYHLSDKQKEILAYLSPESLLDISKSASVGEVAKKAENALITFIGDFTAEKTLLIEKRYRSYEAFKAFCTYDYYFMLKKFDGSMVEASFNSTPAFEKIFGKHILGNIEDIIAVLANVTPPDIDWQSLFTFFKDTRGNVPVNPALWKKIIARLQNLQNSKALPMMAALLSENPDYEASPAPIRGNITEPYIAKLKQEVSESLKTVREAEKKSKASVILQRLFGTAELAYLVNYTDEATEILTKKGLNAYRYCDALNYLKAFLLEFIKKDIREYCELVLVRGKWSEMRLSAPMSNAYNDLLEASTAITAFDKTLSEEGTVGMKIKTHLPQIGHSADAANVINRLVGDANETAKDFILHSVRDIITIGKTVKSLLDDEQEKKGELIINWKELERFAEAPPSRIANDAYNQIYLFTSLMKTCLENT